MNSVLLTLYILWTFYIMNSVYTYKYLYTVLWTLDYELFIYCEFWTMNSLFTMNPVLWTLYILWTIYTKNSVYTMNSVLWTLYICELCTLNSEYTLNSVPGMVLPPTTSFSPRSADWRRRPSSSSWPTQTFFCKILINKPRLQNLDTSDVCIMNRKICYLSGQREPRPKKRVETESTRFSLKI